MYESLAFVVMSMLVVLALISKLLRTVARMVVTLPLRTYVIASEERYLASRMRERLAHVGIRDVRRVDRVSTEERCIGNTMEETGTFYTHRAVWQDVAKLDDAKQWCLVLEEDFRFASVSAQRINRLLRHTLHDHATKATDAIYLGHCYSDLCAHAYALRPAFAKTLLAPLEDVCRTTSVPVDHYLKAKCTSCVYIKGFPTMYGSFGQGIVQKDRRASEPGHHTGRCSKEEVLKLLFP